MDTVTIRNEIQRALNHEAATHELASLLNRRIHGLHTNIVVKQPSRTDESLLRFACKFISRTPELLDTLLIVTKFSRREELCELLADTCQDFFVRPPPLLSGRRGLNGVMVKSYFCHRLIEELNDYCAVTTSTPLLPLNITCSNLIIHHLIGEPFANLLDEIVNDTVVRLQEITAPTLSRENPEPGIHRHKIENLCREHGLLERELSTAVSIASQYFNYTIH